jgi:hypothetical protein
MNLNSAYFLILKIIKMGIYKTPISKLSEIDVLFSNPSSTIIHSKYLNDYCFKLSNSLSKKEALLEVVL